MSSLCSSFLLNNSPWERKSKVWSPYMTSNLFIMEYFVGHKIRCQFHYCPTLVPDMDKNHGWESRRFWVRIWTEHLHLQPLQQKSHSQDLILACLNHWKPLINVADPKSFISSLLFYHYVSSHFPTVYLEYCLSLPSGLSKISFPSKPTLTLATRAIRSISHHVTSAQNFSVIHQSLQHGLNLGWIPASQRLYHYHWREAEEWDLTKTTTKDPKTIPADWTVQEEQELLDWKQNA